MKKNNIIRIIILCFITILAPFYTCISNSNYLDNNNDENEYSLEKLKRSDYSSFSEGIGENINVSLQQSLLDSSIIEFSNISDSDTNSIYEPCPTVQNFNNSLVNITIEDIYAPNKTLIIEDHLPTAGYFDFTSSSFGLTSFSVNNDCYLENISVFCRNLDTIFHVDVRVFISNSTWNNTAQRSQPDFGISPTLLILDIFSIPVGFIIGWYNIINQHYFLDNSLTENNTWFIGLWDIGPGNAQWGYVDDDSLYGGNSDDLDETWSYEKIGSFWQLIDDPGTGCPTVDLNLKVGLTPFNSNPSKELIVEDQSTGLLWNFGITGYNAYGSFRISNNVILENISIRLWNDGDGTNCNFRVRIFNSNWKGTINEPLGLYATVVPIDTVLIDGFDGWYNFTGLNTFLNVSETDNNTFYVVMQDVDDNTYWYMISDDDLGDNDDEMNAYRLSMPGVYELITVGPRTIDLTLKVGLIPHENIPNPEDIGLKINNTAVIGHNDIHGFGYWNSTQVYSSSSGQLEFELSADWWDVSCKISQVQINYAKTDLKANSTFRVLGSGQDVLWNVSRTDGLNFFDTRLSNYRINFTIPSDWNNINVFNGPINKTDDISIGLNKNGYKTIQVVNAGNGTYWHLTAISENLLASIDTYVNSVATEIARYSDIVDFNAIFKEIIAQNDGIINLSVYNPSTIDNELIFASFNSTFASDIEFYLGGWDISDNVTNYGEFRVQISWNNNTAAGFSEKILTIIGETDLTLKTPRQDAIYYSNQSFNIIVYYKDSNHLNAIDGASIQYNINGQGWQSTSSNNGTIGYYIIPVDCSVFTIDGIKTVEIIAGKNYYESQTLDYNFNVSIVEENGKQVEEFPLVIIIITIISTAGGIGAAVVTIILLRKRKRANIVI